MTEDSTRRRYLQAAGGATLAALAGCLGSESEATDTETMGDSMTETGGMDDSMTETETGGMGDSMTETETGGMGDSMTETEGSMEDSMTETATGDGAMETTFAVTVENVSTGETLSTMDGSVAVPLSPGAYAVHSGMGHLFAPGESASAGLEALAEDGTPDALAKEVEMADGVLASGTFATPEGADGAAPIGPGESYAFEVGASAAADPSLSLATMFVQSNDLFYAPGPAGISLFEDGEPVSGEVTMALSLWDAGTEQNQPPGEGDDQAPRQSGPDTGADEMGTVRSIAEVDDGFDYPSVADVVKVTVTPGSM